MRSNPVPYVPPAEPPEAIHKALAASVRALADQITADAIAAGADPKKLPGMTPEESAAAFKSKVRERLRNA